MRRYFSFFYFYLVFGFEKAHGCFQKNISCNDIKDGDGFRFPYERPERSEISVYFNETLLAHAELSSNSFARCCGVVRTDNNSIVTEDCHHLRVIVHTHKGSFVEETCTDYRTIETKSDQRNLPQSSITIIAVVLVLLLLLLPLPLLLAIGIILRRVGKQGSLVSQLSNLLACLRLRIIKNKMQGEETRDHAGHEDQEVSVNDLDTQLTGVSSIDSTADGETPQSVSLDHSSSNEGIHPSINGDTRGPDVNRASDHRAMCRNWRKDFEGADGNEVDVMTRKMPSGWTLGNRGPEDHQNEEQLCLLNRQAGIQTFDMTSEAADLVNKRSFDPDPVSRCSTAPETDVESRPT